MDRTRNIAARPSSNALNEQIVDLSAIGRRVEMTPTRHLGVVKSL